MSNLHTLELSDNYLSGEIPSEIGAMPALMYLFLQNNQFTGTVPAEILPALYPIGTNATNGTGSLLMACNVSNNLFRGNSAPTELCRVNSTFFEEDCVARPRSEQPILCGGCSCMC